MRDRSLFWLFSAVLLFSSSYLHGQDKKSQLPLFRVDVNTVFVKVTVTDSLNRNVTGLKKEDFRIYEDDVLQTITHFSQQSAPISLGFVFDISGSMGYGPKMRVSKNWFTRLLETGSPNPEDEYFLVTFNTKINLIQAFTHNRDELQNDMALRESKGWTALYDAVYRGIDIAMEGKNEKKALILITDGIENSSRYTRAEVREFAVESDVQVYAIGVDPNGYSALKSIAALTGGQVFFPSDDGIDYYIDLIHTELRNQYLLGYVPANNARDGKWRRIKVQLDKPRGFPKLFLRARDGYYAPKN